MRQSMTEMNSTIYAPLASCMLDDDLEVASQAIRALSSPARLRILCLLFEGERSVVELTRLIHGHTQSSVSQHLGFLLKSGIVVNRKYKTRMLYRISDERTQALMQMVAEIFCNGTRHATKVESRDLLSVVASPA